MPLDVLQSVAVIEVLENFLTRKRPPVNIRHQLDLSYKIENQSIIIFEIRPIWNKPDECMECPVAKATFVKTNNQWKVFWMMADSKWHSYKPKPSVKNINDFIKLVEEDKHHCFWGYDHPFQSENYNRQNSLTFFHERQRQFHSRHLQLLRPLVRTLHFYQPLPQL